MPRIRQGLNCTLSYQANGSVRAFRCRVDKTTEEAIMISSESQARTNRAYYPHRRAKAPFTINVMLIGQSERKSFTNFMDAYSAYVLSPELAVGAFPAMLVQVPSRGFVFNGVPTAGAQAYGDHLAAMVWNHNVTFESVPSVLSNSSASRPDNILNRSDNATQFFYPFTTQLGAGQAPAADIYQKILSAANGNLPIYTTDANGNPITPTADGTGGGLILTDRADSGGPGIGAAPIPGGGGRRN